MPAPSYRQIQTHTDANTRFIYCKEKTAMYIETAKFVELFGDSVELALNECGTSDRNIDHHHVSPKK